MSSVLHVVLAGQMPSGKGQIRTQILGGRLHRFPQKRFTDWRSTAWAQLDRQRGAWEKITVPARITVRYTPGDLIRRDAPGIIDALVRAGEDAFASLMFGDGTSASDTSAATDSGSDSGAMIFTRSDTEPWCEAAIMANMQTFSASDQTDCARSWPMRSPAAVHACVPASGFGPSRTTSE